MSDHDNDKTHAKLETPNKEQDRAEKKAHHEAKGESTHKTYLAGFAQSAKQLQDWFKQDPNIKSKIEGGGY